MSGSGSASSRGLATIAKKFPTPTKSDANNALMNSGGNPTLKGVVYGVTDQKNQVIPENMRGGGLNPTWVEALMGWPINFTRISGNDKEESREAEILQYVRQPDVSETLWKAVGGLECMDAEAFLFAFLRKYEEGGRLPRRIMEGKVSPEEILREMRRGETIICAPCGRGQNEQRQEEHTDLVRQLSLVVASRSKTPWDSSLWECAIPRVATGVPARVDRLKALGNGQVPQCAAEAWRCLTKEI